MDNTRIYTDKKSKYVRADKSKQINLEDARKAIKNGTTFFNARAFMDILEVNLTDKYFKAVFEDDPIYGIETLIQFEAIRLYDFSFLLKSKQTKEE